MGIKSEELRRLNWVYGSIRKNEPVQIMSIDNTICKAGEYLEGYESINPIPLTAEILDGCGIEKVLFLDSTYRLERFTLTICPDGKVDINIGEEFICWIQYLHDLQNWFYFNHQKRELPITNLK